MTRLARWLSAAALCGALGACASQPVELSAAAPAQNIGLKGRQAAWIEASDKGAMSRCLGVWIDALLLVPEHCLLNGGGQIRARASESGELSAPLTLIQSSKAKDYALFEAPLIMGVYPASAKDLIQSAPFPGALLMVGARSGWIEARATSYGSGSFWAQARGCVKPGDSGAPIWALREGAWRWAGMLVSGVANSQGCLESLVGVSASAIAWGAWYPR